MTSLNSPHAARDAAATCWPARSVRALSIYLVLCAPAASAQPTRPPVAHESSVATAQLPAAGRPPLCSELRTGPADAPGCYLIASQPVGAAPAAPLFWHIDEFPTRSAAEAARQARSTVGEAHGRVWLLTIAGADWKPASGTRVARIGPLPVTTGRQYTAHLFEGVAPPAARTNVHRHPGPEAWYVLEGTPCLETPEGAHVMRPGESFIVPEGTPMMLTGTGTALRRTLGLVLHDSAKDWGADAPDWAPKGTCAS